MVQCGQSQSRVVTIKSLLAQRGVSVAWTHITFFMWLLRLWHWANTKHHVRVGCKMLYFKSLNWWSIEKQAIKTIYVDDLVTLGFFSRMSHAFNISMKYLSIQQDPAAYIWFCHHFSNLCGLLCLVSVLYLGSHRPLPLLIVFILHFPDLDLLCNLFDLFFHYFKRAGITHSCCWQNVALRFTMLALVRKWMHGK